VAIRFTDTPSRLGRINATFDDVAAVLSGTHVRPPGRTAQIFGQLDPLTMAGLGAVTSAPARTGSISATLGNLAGLIQGSAGLPVPALLSRSLPTFSSSGTAANAVSSNYNSLFQSAGAAVTIAQDVSGLTSAQKASNALYFYCEAGADTTSLYFDVARGGNGGSRINQPNAYTIEGNTAAGGTLPTSGWTTLVTVTANGYASRKHTFSLSGLNWYRLNITSSSGSSVQLKMDLYDISAGNRDILHLGDSRVWFGLNHANPHGGSSAAASLGDLMQPTARFFAPTINTGMSGNKAADINNLLTQWISNGIICKWATLNIGINDALASAWSSAWTTSYQGIVNRLIAAGCTVFCESIGDTSAAGPHANLPAYNSAIAGVVAATPGCLTGYDEYGFFVSNPSFISGDQVHATDAGFAALRTAKAAFYAGVV
jgi:hypothetical protein